MADNDSPLEMTFMPNTIEHLGARMYSTLPPVLAELVANSYDADASEIHIKLNDSGDKEIVVIDNGHGMSSQDINNKFLRIGRNRRDDDQSQTSPKGRPVIGKKGLGKLSFFGIAHEIHVQTQKDNFRNSFVLDWNKIVDYSDGEELKNYHPDVVENNVVYPGTADGTTITLKAIQRVSSFDLEAIADSLAKIFILDPSFKVFISHNGGQEILIENDRKYSSLNKEFEWKIPQDINLESDYQKASQVKGHLIATKTPISPKTNMRGITLFSRKKLVNLPEYFSDSTSSHFFSYLTGWLEVDFIDELDEDVIETNRQSLNWDNEDMVALRKYLQSLIRWLERDWRKKRSSLQEKKIEEKTGMKISEWKDQLPESIRTEISPVIDALTKNSEFPDKEEETVETLKGLHELIPPYPYFHWRNLHPTLQSLVFDYYKNQDYYTAVVEGVKKYLNELKAKSGSTLADRELVENVWALRSPSLSVIMGFIKPDGTNFETQTLDNIVQGHRMLAVAMWQAFRSPIAHEVVADLRDSGLYTETDCLDALSLLSHLYNRLEKSSLVTQPTTPPAPVTTS